jgi:hypothetical protein
MQIGSPNIGINFIENGTSVANGVGSEDNLDVTKPSNALVVYCDALYRMDYTFLQVSIL